jgi:hypothetical protein
LISRSVARQRELPAHGESSQRRGSLFRNRLRGIDADRGAFDAVIVVNHQGNGSMRLVDLVTRPGRRSSRRRRDEMQQGRFIALHELVIDRVEADIDRARAGRKAHAERAADAFEPVILAEMGRALRRTQKCHQLLG